MNNIYRSSIVFLVVSTAVYVALGYYKTPNDPSERNKCDTPILLYSGSIGLIIAGIVYVLSNSLKSGHKEVCHSGDNILNNRPTIQTDAPVVEAPVANLDIQERSMDIPVMNGRKSSKHRIRETILTDPYN